MISATVWDENKINAEGVIKGYLEGVARHLTAFAVKDARTAAKKYAYDKGRYARSFRVVRHQGSGNLQYVIYNDAPYASYIEYGVRTRRGRPVNRLGKHIMAVSIRVARKKRNKIIKELQRMKLGYFKNRNKYRNIRSPK